MLLNNVVNTSQTLPDFFWVSERLVEGDFDYIREPYHKVAPNIRYAYEKVFGASPNFESFIFGAGAQFCVSKKIIHKRSLDFYKNILNIFEHESGVEPDEIYLKLIGTNNHINPEFGLHLERFWGIIFNNF